MSGGNRPNVRMRINLFHAIPLLLIAISEVVSAGGDEVRRLRGPDHLVPAKQGYGDWHDRYIAQLDKRLELSGFAFARMVVRPSFDGESTVFLHGADGDRDIGTTEQFFLTHIKADTSIWYAMPDNNEAKQQKEVKVTRVTVPIGKPLAIRLQKDWIRMLDRTREPDEPGSGLDGVTVEFRAAGKTGETWTPDRRLSTGMLVQLGYEMIALFHTPAEDRPAAVKAIEKASNRLRKYLDGVAGK